MIISVITLFPELYQAFTNTSLIARARSAGLLTIDVSNIFDLVKAKERIDSPTFGHGSGMLIKPEIVEKAIVRQEGLYGKGLKVFFSPSGKKLNQDLLRSFAQRVQDNHLILLPARYEGMDCRVEQYYADETISLGDFVLMGGDIPAMALIEGVTRLVPGVVGKAESVELDSFMGPFVDYPHYTDPVDWKGLVVPEVIRSGNHKELETWRKDTAAFLTVTRHFDWLRSHVSDKGDISLAAKFIPSHYAVLMHDQVFLENGREGTSSVTSIDIHDIARSAKTYGIKNYYIVTPLADQQKIIKKLLEFWNTNAGIEYNPSRHAALESVILKNSLDEVIEEIKQKEACDPLLIATAAKEQPGVVKINYNEQERIWALKRPILIIFGTARGLATSVIEKCNFAFDSIRGFSTFNHLSVRSAASIVFDRWLGINRR